MLSKRKALIGYAVYTIGKPLAKRKLKRQQAETAKKRKSAGRRSRRPWRPPARPSAASCFFRKRRLRGQESTEG